MQEYPRWNYLLMPIKTSSCKAKGRKLQQYIAKRLTEVFNLGEGDCESRPMGSPSVDIMMSPKARKLFPFSIESKSWKKTPSRAAIEQANHNKYRNTLAAVVWKPPRVGPAKSIIMFDFEEFMVFWAEYNKEVTDEKTTS